MGMEEVRRHHNHGVPQEPQVPSSKVPYLRSLRHGQKKRIKKSYLSFFLTVDLRLYVYTYTLHTTHYVHT